VRQTHSRAAVEFVRGAVCHDAPVAQQHHLVGHRHRFGLVMGDVDIVMPSFCCKARISRRICLPQLRIEVR